MKKLLLNIFCTTGLAITVLAVIVALQDWDIHFYSHVFQVLGANAIVHIGLMLIRKLHRSINALNRLADVSYVAIVLIVFGWRFLWFYVTPIWVLILMAAGIYLAVCILEMWRAREEIGAINILLKKRNKKQH
ncbi:MAG: hypothetical protein FWC92_06655 [Defluviitaleaceae bacterium]|nr:hypothetical protein [Defluviitaleaceae bacterium]